MADLSGYSQEAIQKAQEALARKQAGKKISFGGSGEQEVFAAYKALVESDPALRYKIGEAVAAKTPLTELREQAARSAGITDPRAIQSFARTGRVPLQGAGMSSESIPTGGMSSINQGRTPTLHEGGMSTLYSSAKYGEGVDVGNYQQAQVNIPYPNPQHPYQAVSNIMAEKGFKEGFFPSVSYVKKGITNEIGEGYEGIAGGYQNIARAYKEKFGAEPISTGGINRETGKKFGKAVGNAYVYGTPGVGELSFASDVVEFKPQIKDIQTAEFIDYGKAQELGLSPEEVQAYNKELAKEKKLLPLAITGYALGAAAPFIAKGAGKLIEPQIIKTTYLPQKEKSTEFLFFGKENANKFKVFGVTKTPEVFGQRTTPVRDLFFIPRKKVMVSPGRTDRFILDVESPFLNKEGVSRGLGAIKREGPGVTLKKAFEAFGKNEELPLEQTPFLSAPKKYLMKETFKGLSPLGPDTKFFQGGELLFKGRPLEPQGQGLLRLNRYSKNGYELGVGRKVTDRAISISRVDKYGSFPTADVFKVKTGAKSISSAFPRSSGRIEKAKGVGFVFKDLESSSPGEVILSSGQKLTKEQKAKLAAGIGQQVVSYAKKIKNPGINIPKSKAATFLKEEAKFLKYPFYVGGAGKEQSLFYGKGRPGLTSENIGGLMIGVTKNSLASASNSSFFQSPKISVRNFEKPREQTFSALVPNIGTDTIISPAINPKEKERITEVTIPKLREKVKQLEINKQIQIPKINIFPRVPKSPTGRTSLKKSPVNNLYKGKKKSPVRVVVESKRRGKFFSISKPVSPDAGLDIGIGYVRRGLARTFRLKAIGGSQEQIQLSRRPSADIFRASKGRRAGPFTFVEKAPFALRGSPTAVREIISSRKAGRMRFL